MFFLHPTEPSHKEKVEISANSKQNFHPAHDAKPKQKSAQITFVRTGLGHTCALPHTSKNCFNSITSKFFYIHFTVANDSHDQPDTVYQHLRSALLMLPHTPSCA
ncbi:hypothetical protein M758_7G079000 [Ceratodon purpureus]|nr:hypothetical protein M758_7G079000 [Ceratodon purpureus]